MASTSALRLLPVGMHGKMRLANLIYSQDYRARECTIRLSNGSFLHSPNLLEPVAFSLFIDGVYEPLTMRFLNSFAGTNSTFIDVGANIGAFSIPLARRFSRVFAIEASPSVLVYLRRNVSLNDLDNVSIVPCAASKPGVDSVPLYIPPDKSFGMASSAPQFHAEPISVPAISIDSLVDQSPETKVSVIKVDTEGFEADVFLGAKNLLSRPDAPPIVFEFCDWAESRCFSPGAAQRALLSFGRTS